MGSHAMSEEARESFARLNELLKRLDAEEEARREAERLKRGNLTSIERASLLLIREAKR